MNMSRTKKPTSKCNVTDEEIETALAVLKALRYEVKAHSQRRWDRVPHNEAWDARTTGIQWDLRASLDGIHCLKLDLKHWLKRRLKIARQASALEPATATGQ